VAPLDAAPISAQPVEVVERKGLGHPDTICDALAEEVSLALSRFYLERFGLILHHNVDKVLLRGGAARATFGGGEVLEPIEIYLAGRATREVRGEPVPVDELALDACRAWLRERIHALDVERHVRLRSLIRPGSADLVDVFERAKRGAPLANDSSIGVGFAPLSPLEAAVLDVERSLQRRARPERGEDVKVLGVRNEGRSALTVACAFVAPEIPDLAAYRAARARTLEDVRAIVPGDVALELNSADDLATGSVYLTVTGTSAEAGDDGQTGRGNRANGLITPARPMTLESIAGKNPINHVGKLYNVAALRIAEALVAELAGLDEAQVTLVSQIGKPIDAPQTVALMLRTQGAARFSEIALRARELACDRIAAIGSLWQELIGRNLALASG
jgi:S-adenosylmethionine synthetase